MELKDYIVPKPWGYEYLIFENNDVGIWWLHLNKGEKTSLHCHPDKKTSLIVMKGEALVSFLNSDVKLQTFSKTIIREGVFHSTMAISQNGLSVIEVETPKNKENIVRMEDVYGRKGKQYESIQECTLKTGNELWIEDKIGEKKIHNEHEFCINYLTAELLNKLNREDILIILSPVAIASREGFAISKLGDTIKVHLAKRLLNDFILEKNAYALIIKKNICS